jgi:serine protease inhibitor
MKKLLLSIVIILLSACNGSFKSKEALKEASLNAKENFKLTKEEQKIVDSTNQFSIRLFKQLQKSQADKSMLLSTISISYGLNILNNGTSGTTQNELCKLLGYSKKDLNAVNTLCRRMIIGQYSKTEQYLKGIEGSNDSMKSSNLLAIDKSNTIKDDLLPLIQRDYFADVMTVDMAGDAKEKINQWCCQQTDSAIKKIPLDIDNNISACLINATIFDGSWSHCFDEVENKPFYKENGKKVMVPMMYQKNDYQSFIAYRDELLSALLLTFHGQFSMLILLPNKGKTIADITNHLTLEKLQKIRSMLKDYDTMYVSIPKFTLKSNLSMSKSLKEMGARRLFSDNAEITGFTEQPLKVRDFVQDSEMIIDEAGTHIKSVTGFELTSLGMKEHPTEFTFNADHPFLFIINDYFGNICFIGQYQGDL